MSAQGLFAHTPACPDGPWHDLKGHVEAVAELAAAFASRFGGGAAARALGLAHDAGKADPRFQHYLREAHAGRAAAKCPHAYAGAVAAYGELRTLALAVAGHHAGIPDKGEWKSKIVPRADVETVQAAREFLAVTTTGQCAPNSLPQWATASPLAADMFVRMVFSCLVDADRLDTEAHCRAGQPPERGQYPSLEHYRDLLTKKLAHFDGKSGTVNDARREILQACLDAAEAQPGVYTLTVPTGGGKTLSGLAFALSHAVRHGKRRVVVAIPYTSIIDQTAVVYADVFGDENLLEHHSALEVDDAEEFGQRDVRRRLATENWDCPLIVTTTVQLFESLLSNRPSKCRKLHNLADSVIIVDEVQALPEKCLGPILDVLFELTEHYGVTVVLSTATPPDYEPVDPRLLQDAREILPGPERHFASLRRVRFEFPEGDWDVERVREELERHEQALVVLNTRKDAVAILEAARGLEGLFHLSTLLCGHHRKAILAEVRDRLNQGLPVRLVSTQVVEAGVDLDFPRVYRAIGPLDRIVQAAGRCNREGRRDGLGDCVVFRFAPGGMPRGAYATGTALTGPLLPEFGQNLAQPEATRRYTRDLYSRTETGATSSKGDRAVVQSLRQELKFKSVADTFKMIEQDTVPLVVETYAAADVPAFVATWNHRPAGWFQRVSPFTVNVYRHELARLQADGHAREHESGAWIYSGPYDPLMGLTPETPDPADLMA